MPPINVKVEAQRLQQAKSAIKKMKQKRMEGKRVQLNKTTSNHLGCASKGAPFFINVPQKKIEVVDSQSIFNVSSDVTKKEKQSTSDPIRKGVTKSRKINGVLGETHREVSSRVDNSSNSANICKKKVKKGPIVNIPQENGVSDFKYFYPHSSTLDDSDREEVQTDSGSTFDFCGPFIAPSKLGKTHSRKKIVSESNHIKSTNSANSVSSSTQPAKVKVKNMKRLNRSRALRTSKVRCAPMSVRMKSGSIQGPIFTVTQDDSCNQDEMKGKEMCSVLSAQVSCPKIPCSSFSAFSVTTVSDRTLTTEEITDDEDTNSDSENGMLSDDESQPEERERSSDTECVTNDFESVEETSEKLVPVSNDWSKAEFHFIDGHVILFLKHPSTFAFCGQVQFEVLMGTVEVLGHHFTPASGCQSAFSARGSSLLSVQTVLSNDSCDGSPILKESCSLASLASQGNDGDAMLLMKKSENTLPQFLEQYVNIKLFPNLPEKIDQNSYMKASKRLQCLCYPPSGSHIFRKGEDWDNICGNIGLQSVAGCTVICGGKGVGKSTMLRFLLNRLLSCGKEKVILIDFDPGQSEMTVPGCVSLSVVDKPLLGPNFTHLQESLKCVYVGDVNVSNCASRYMDACLTIINCWQSDENLRELPCVVNTIGFNKGLGVSIMVQILELLQPTNVIQVQSKFSSRNYPEQLTVEYVKRMCSSSPFRQQVLAHSQQASCPSSLNYILNIVMSVTDTMSEHCDTLGITARPLREIVTLSYLSKIARPPNFSLLETAPYCCPLDALHLNVCHENVPPFVTLSAFNASLVALCSIDPQEENITQPTESGFPSIIRGHITADCLGFGIVRGIDMEAQNLYLLTPEPPTVLARVNCLVLGAVCLPPSIYLTPSKEPGVVPYVVITGSQHAAQPSKRSFRFNRLIGNS
ncbi:Polynucleotide 5'-hydroxyl-kinase NOL9 [Frankliniella fusca]|uniref:Polynucleotide 5'-hydroxyl-kinase NOL9 n=1 Tax=Frankliniella fusca TaxID=407009 RepID=A0AAE1HU12_9NEOP|nr:Polynucleotide 5'-hydroxyl-kinase NOL9 [Frankliniella fusca]